MTRFTEAEAAGMTVNERLFVAGLLEVFDQAYRTRRRDETAVRAILALVFLDAANIDSIVKRVLNSS